MADWTISQWIIIPLIVLGDAVVALGILGLFLYPLATFARGLRVPIADIKANTPKQRT